MFGLNPRSLRGRLTLAYVATLVVSLVVFAAVAFFAVDRMQRREVDRELEATARALSVVAEREQDRFAPHGPDHEHDPEHRGVVRDDSEVDSSLRMKLQKELQEQLTQLVGPGRDAAIFAADGTLLAASAVSIPASVRRLAGVPLSWLQMADGNDPGRYVRIAAFPIVGHHGGGAVVVWRGADIDELVDRQLLLVFAFLIPLVAFLGLLGGNAIAREGLRPLEKMADVASEIEAKDLSGRIALPPSNDELGRLAEAFDRMLDRLQSSFSRERRFTSDASHELRAPLSVVRASADYALLRERDPAEYRRALQMILAEADELEAVTRDLLAIARAESAAPKADAVDVSATAAKAADRLAALANARSIMIRRSLDADCIATGDDAALSRVAVALLHNALKFAREGGAVELTVSRDADGVALTIADDGPGFSPQALRHATERFWRDDASRGRGQGTGLGLAIACASIEAMGGSLVLANRASGGAEVRVRLRRYGTPVGSV
jgi:signal transduction histidine kinase